MSAKSITIDVRRHGKDANDHLPAEEIRKAEILGMEKYARRMPKLLVVTDTCRTMETACALARGAKLGWRVKFDMIRDAEAIESPSAVRGAILDVFYRHDELEHGSLVLIITHLPFVEAVYELFNEECTHIPNLGGVCISAHLDVPGKDGPVLEFNGTLP